MAFTGAHYSLGIGEAIIIRDGGVISTVLGSCVAICIYSLDGSIGGMNHFVLPKMMPGGRPDDIYRYGDDSCKALIETILKQDGVDKKQLRAKIIGGASVLKNEGISNDIGLQNIATAKRALQAFGIQLVAEDTGGTEGRKVFFYTEGGKVRVSLLKADSREVPKLDPSLFVSKVATVSSLPAAKTPVSVNSIPSPSPKAVVSSPSFQEPIKRREKTRVLIVDDSKTIQEFLKKIFADDPELDVVGVANHPGEAETILKSTAVDVMTLDIQMPVMDGIAFLEKLMPSRPMPVVMLTSMRMEDGDHVLRALELGAVDYIQKPKLQDIAAMGKEICEKVKSASYASVRRKLTSSSQNAPKSKSAMRSRGGHQGMSYIVIGSSTGGTVALTEILTALPSEIPPILIVQHIPAGFSRAFADRLNTLCPFEVKEAVDGDEIGLNRVLIAPGGKQMKMENRGGRFVVAINDDEPVNRHKPSVDYLFESVQKFNSKEVLGIILTGMGADGAKGLLGLKEGGAYTIAQDEKSCVVYGMPKEAVKLGAVHESLALDSIAARIQKWMNEHKAVA